MAAELPEGPIVPDLIIEPGQEIPIAEETWPREYDEVYAEWDYKRWVVIGGYGYGTVSVASSVIIEGCVVAESLPNHPLTHIIAGILGTAGVFGWYKAKQTFPDIEPLVEEKTAAWKKLEKF